MQYIYKINNVVDDSFYVGSTQNVKRRRWEHWDMLKKRVHHCAALQAAWDVLGEDAFDFAVVEEVEDGVDVFLIEETYLLQHAGKTHCYNTAYTTQNPPAVSAATSEKIRQTMLRIYADKTAHPRLGKKHTEETKARISASRTGKMAGAEHYRFGKMLTAEVRAKIGDTQRGISKGAGRRVSEEGLAKIRAAADAGHYSHWTGRKHAQAALDAVRKPVTAHAPDGVAKTYPSIQALREDLKLKPPTVNRALKSGQPLTRGPFCGWTFKYACIPPAPVVQSRTDRGNRCV